MIAKYPQSERPRVDEQQAAAVAAEHLRDAINALPNGDDAIDDVALRLLAELLELRRIALGLHDLCNVHQSTVDEGAQ